MRERNEKKEEEGKWFRVSENEEEKKREDEYEDERKE